MSRWLLRAAVAALVVVGVVGYRERARTTPQPEVAREPEARESASAPAAVDARPEAPEFEVTDVAVHATDPWPARNRRGIELLEAGELREAAALFESCAEAVPGEPAYRGNWAEALARLARHVRADERDLDAAIATLERALEVDPERISDLGPLLQRWREEAELESEFSEFDSPYFELSFDGTRAELLHASQRFLDVLEEAYTDYRLWFGFDPVLEGRPPFRVVLYRRGEFQRLTGLGDWAAGAFDGTIRLPVEADAVGGEDWRDVARHELVHAFVREVGGASVPGWLNEGLAQWLEGPADPRVARARARLAGRTLFELERLQSSLAGWQDEASIRAAYDQSLVFTDYLIRNYGEGVVADLVAGCAEGVRPPATFLRRTGVDLNVVLGDLAHETR